jgi:hypothetical protein
VTSIRCAAIGVFLILFGSYAYFWQSRDWNTASRLLLAYALVERGTVSIDGFEICTGDRAYVNGHYYSDKLPGLSFLAIPPYVAAKYVLKLPDHPVKPAKAFPYRAADYWATLGTAGLATALAGALLTILAGDLGCGPRRAALIGLAYGLATPAYAYATLAYGHQVTAAALLGAFALLWRPASDSLKVVRAGLAGFLAAGASAVELQVAPVSAILGLWCVALVLTRRWPIRALSSFMMGASLPMLVVLIYNFVAFGSPWDMGYFHEDLKQFQQVHNAGNRLGLGRPNWGLLRALLWGGHRGLFFYAPILLLSVPGWIVLAVRRSWAAVVVSAAVCAAVLLVNLSYPEWTGGWSTGPRLLIPLIPFGMLPVASLLAVTGKPGAIVAICLTIVGGVLMLLFVGVGARLPHYVLDPLQQVVAPLWSGDPIPRKLWIGEDRFTRNIVSATQGRWVRGLTPATSWMQFLPLVAFQVVGILGLVIGCRTRCVPTPRKLINADPAGSSADPLQPSARSLPSGLDGTEPDVE